MIDKMQHIYKEKQTLDLSWSEYKWPLIFLVSMSMMGLRFPLGYLFVPVVLINRFLKDRYDFMIMISLFFGAFGLIGEGTLPIKTWDICFAVAVICIIVLKKNLFIKKTLLLFVGYTLALIFIATFSDERMSVQIRIIREYLYFIYFIVPFVVFAGRKFEMSVFFRKLMPYVIVLCGFYILDCYIISGKIFLPCTYTGHDSPSTFYDLTLYGFGKMPRIYPPGLFILALAVYPVAKVYKLLPWQWIFVALALYASRTFTVISGLIATYVLSLPNFGRIVKYGLGAVVLLAVIYGIDSMLPMNAENEESTFRIYSSINQLTDFSNAQDDEDMAELGSGRIGQAIPKFELINEMGKQMFGLGFLHPKLTTDTRYIIDNPFYHDNTKSEEVATGIEVEPLQVYLSAGYVGLVVHFLFLFLTYFLVRKCRYSFYYITVLFALFWFGLGGFSGLNNHDGLILCSLAFSLVALDQRTHEDSGISEEIDGNKA